MELTNTEAIIEALLFASGEAVEIKTLTEILKLEEYEVKSVVADMNYKYKKEKRALVIRNIDTCYQLCTNPEYHEYIKKMSETKTKQNLSQAAMETLAIVAYKQPVTKQEIEKIRGVSSDRSVSILSEFGLIEDIGRKDAPGRPIIYGTTMEFLRTFGYTNIHDLPKIQSNFTVGTNVTV